MKGSGRRVAARLRQGGISLLFALFALIIMGLAAVALVRSVDTGTLIMGNLGFRQDTVTASSSGAEQALSWLQTTINTGQLDNDIPASGYYASDLAPVDITGNRTNATTPLATVNWDGNCQGMASGSYTTCTTLPYLSPTSVNGNTVRWLITRMCNATGSAASGSNLCVRPATSGTGSVEERGELQPGGRIAGLASSPFFRIIVRVEGPRNTVSYTETLVHF